MFGQSGALTDLFSELENDRIHFDFLESILASRIIGKQILKTIKISEESIS